MIINKKCLVPVFLTLIILTGIASGTKASNNLNGLILSLKGDVTLCRPNTEPRNIIEGYPLVQGDTLKTAGDAFCNGYTPDGEEFEMGSNEIYICSKQKSDSGNILITFLNRQIDDWMHKSRLQSLITRSVRDWDYRNRSIRLLIPAGRGKVRNHGSDFIWAKVESVDLYELTISDKNGKEMQRIVRGTVTSIDELEPGEYTWMVSLKKDGWKVSSSPRAFTVMSKAEEKKLDDLVKDMTDLKAGVLLYISGLHLEAVSRFDSAANVDKIHNSALRWRAKAMSEIGLYREAYNDLLKTIE